MGAKPVQLNICVWGVLNVCVVCVCVFYVVGSALLPSQCRKAHINLPSQALLSPTPHVLGALVISSLTVFSY